VLKAERDIVISSPPLQASDFEAGGIRWTYVFYESGLSINVMYTIEDPKKRAVGFKLSEGMEIPEELASRFDEAVNDAIRSGAGYRRTPFVTETASLGLSAVNLDRALQLAGDLEDEELIRKTQNQS
jgi:hypothetical protein